MWESKKSSKGGEMPYGYSCPIWKYGIELTPWRRFETTVLDDVMTIAGMRDPLSYPSGWNASVISTCLDAATAS